MKSIADRIAILEKPSYLTSGRKIRLNLLRRSTIRATFTEDEVRTLRREFAEGMTVADASRKYKRAESTLRAIKLGHSWGWLDAD